MNDIKDLNQQNSIDLNDCDCLINMSIHKTKEYEKSIWMTSIEIENKWFDI